MSDKYNPEITTMIKNFLAAEEWKYYFNDKDGVFYFNIGIDGKMNYVHYVVGIGKNSYNVYAVSPLSANAEDPKQMQAAAEFVCRANYGLRNGNFELDFRDGDIQYKCFVDCNGTLPPERVVRTSFYCPAAMFERYGQGIIEVLFNGRSAAGAVALCENDAYEEEAADDQAHTPS